MPDREALREIERLLASARRGLIGDPGCLRMADAALARVRALLAEPPVPDEQAIERAGRALVREDDSLSGDYAYELAKIAITAALEQPE